MAERSISRQPTYGGSPALPQEPKATTLLSGAVSDISDIMKAEFKLASMEMRDDAKALARTVPIGATGGVLAGVGVVLLLLALVFGLDVVLPLWASYLIGGGVTLLIATALLLFVRNRLTDWKAFVPERAIAMMQENKQWMLQRKPS